MSILNISKDIKRQKVMFYSSPVGIAIARADCEEWYEAPNTILPLQILHMLGFLYQENLVLGSSYFVFFIFFEFFEYV